MRLIADMILWTPHVYIMQAGTFVARDCISDVIYAYQVIIMILSFAFQQILGVERPTTYCMQVYT